MPSIREQILARIAAQLALIPGVTVMRSRTTALVTGEFPAALVQPGPERVQYLPGATAERALTVRVVVLARGTPADQAADPTIIAVIDQLLADPRQGGLALRTEEVGTDPALADSGAGDVYEGVVEFVITYRTDVRDITLQR